MMNTNKPEVILNSVAQIAAKLNGVEPVWIEFNFNGRLYRTNGATTQGKDGSTWNTTNSIPVVLAGRDIWGAK